MITIFIKKVIARVTWIMKGRPVPPPMLEMVWPENLLSYPPEIKVTEGYRLRQFEQGDTENYYKMLTKAGMQQPSLTHWNQHILPNGFFVIEHEASHSLVAACFASHRTAPRHPQAGNLGWLAVDPAHRGKSLGYAVSAAVTTRLIAGGYRRLYLETHDYRLPAIAIYLKMGWLPLIYLPEMEVRWSAICQTLQWPFTIKRDAYDSNF